MTQQTDFFGDRLSELQPPHPRGSGRAALVLIPCFLAACGPRDAAPVPGATGTMRERVAALVLRQTDFGGISILPIRYVHSRIAGPFTDDGRTLYCVSTRMKGRTFGKAERAKALVRDDAGTLRIVEDNEEVCEGHRTEPFPELETLGNANG